MRSQLIVVLLVGLAASTYAYRLPDEKKRSTEIEPRIFDALQEFYAQVIYRPLNHIVTNLALLSAQVFAGIAENGIPAPNGRTTHLSEAQIRGFWDDLWNNALKPPIEQAIQTVSLLGAQVLAGIGTNGINLSLGKREITEADARFLDTLADALNSVFTNVIQKPLEDALASGALMLAQVLAGIGTNGVNLSSLLGKRDLNALSGREEELRNFFDTLGQNLLNGLQSVWTNVIQGPLEQAIQTTALLGAQVLAGIGTNGISLGKRELEAEARGQVIDTLVSHANNLFQTQVVPVLENALNAAALHLAGVLANLSQTIG
jgi:hypothetical protein